MSGNPQIDALQASIDALKAQLAQDEANYNEALDTVWMLLTGFLVWLMAAGFCFLEMGSVRYKNSQNILAKNIIVPVLGFICWYILGYGLGFGTGSSTPGKFASGALFVANGFWDDKTQFRKWFFQGCFCDTSASIVSGGIAERMTLFGFCVHTIFMTSIIYPIGVYWAWSGYGWLNYTEDGVNYKSTIGPWYQDWAGSGVIHFVGGVAALVGAVIVGPRKGRFDGTASEDEFTPHSVPFTVLGTFILWFGWYGFNPGSTGQMHTAATAYTSALVAVNTTLAPCTAGLVAFIGRRLVFAPKRFDVGALCNGILAGCVAVTAPCGWVKPWEAVIIGGIGGLFYLCSAAILPKLKIDDPIEAISVHMVNGLWGTLAIGFFGDPKEGINGNGVFYGGNQLGVQVVACICFGVWAAVLSVAVFLPMRLMGVLRWSDSFQEAGADEMQHSPRKGVDHGDLKVLAQAPAPAQQAEPHTLREADEKPPREPDQALGLVEAGVASV